jgi:aromatic ring hydroxylase
MRDGRTIYIGAARVDDVTRHPAFRNAKLYKLVWDLIGSDFVGRQMLYERFYAGNSIIVRNQNDREAPWAAFHAMVDGMLERVQAPDLPALVHRR